MLQKITNTFKQKSITSVQGIEIHIWNNYYSTMFTVSTSIQLVESSPIEVSVNFEGTNIKVNISLPAPVFNIVKKLRLMRISSDNNSYKKTSTVIENLEKLCVGVEELNIVNRVISIDNKLSFDVHADSNLFLTTERTNHPTLGDAMNDSTAAFFSMFHYRPNSKLLSKFSSNFEKLIRRRIDLFVDLYNRTALTPRLSHLSSLSSNSSQTTVCRKKDEVSLIRDLISKLTDEDALGYKILRLHFSLYFFGNRLEDFVERYIPLCDRGISETAHRIKKLPGNFIEAASNYLALSHSDRVTLKEKFIDVLVLIDKKIDEYKKYVDENNVSEFKTTLAFIEQVLNK